MQSLDITPPMIALKQGKRGIMVSTVRRVDDFARGLLAVTATGPRRGDVVIDSSLRQFRVASSKKATGSILDRLRSIVSPKPIRYDVIFDAPEAISLAEVKSAVAAALTSSNSVREYWNETTISVDHRLKMVAEAESFSSLCKALRH